MNPDQAMWLINGFLFGIAACLWFEVYLDWDLRRQRRKRGLDRNGRKV